MKRLITILVLLGSAGTVTSQGALTVTAGGAGTIATGQFVTELQMD